MDVISTLAQCALDFLVDERCHACGARVGAAAGQPSHALAAPIDVVALPGLRLQTRVLCAACAERVISWREPVVLTSPASRAPHAPLAVFPAFVTDERVLTLIHLLKFGGRERLAPWLAVAMTNGLPNRARAWLDAAPLVAPVPMDRAARVRRGFNQAESIARILASAWNLPLCADALGKVRRTRPQSALGREERLVNLEGAFEADTTVVRNRAVILVDDLVTTGATVFACASALRAAGACGVRVVCTGYRDDELRAGTRSDVASSILTRTSGAE